MPTFNDLVIDGALDYITTNVDGVTVNQTASSTALTGTEGVDASNWAKADNVSGGGRKLTFDTSAGDMSSINVTGSGTATRLWFLDSAVQLVMADLSPSVILASTDTVKINSFEIAIKDPT
jgi:hypothetical protein